MKSLPPPTPCPSIFGPTLPLYFRSILFLPTLVFALLCLVQCSPLVIRHDYDPDADFGQYRSFAWLPEPLVQPGGDPLRHNPLLGKKIRQAVNDNLVGRGLSKDLDEPDLLIAYHNRVRDKRDVDVYSYGYWGTRAVDVDQYQESTLVIDFVDRRTNQLVWRGWSVAALDAYTDFPRRLHRQLNEAVNQILKRYPPY
jgi:hypothetical protein